MDLWSAPSHDLLWMFHTPGVKRVVHNLFESFCTRTVLKLRDTSLAGNLQTSCSAVAEELRTHTFKPSKLTTFSSFAGHNYEKSVSRVAYLGGELHVHFL